MAAALRNQVVLAYRSLLNAQRVLFQQDTHRRLEAKKFTRTKFEQNRSEKDEAKINEMLKVATDSKKYIDSHVIQAQVNNKGRYGASNLNSRDRISVRILLTPAINTEMKIRDTTYTTQDTCPPNFTF